MSKNKAESSILSDSTIIEVVRIKGDEVVVKEMEFLAWKKLVKQEGYRYVGYQKGFSSFKK